MSALLMFVLAATSPNNWSTTFEPSIVETYLDGEAPAVLVVGGDKSEATIEAAQALESALRSVKRVSLVMNGASIGDPGEFSDEQLALKAKGLPIGFVLVVRVFPATDAPVVVVSVLNLQGRVMAAFTANRGKSPVARQGGASRGVSEAALAAVVSDQEQKKRSPSPSEPQSEYDQKRIEWSSRATNEWAIPYQGARRRPLRGAEFYSALGRGDLAESYNSRRTLKTTLLVAGPIAMGAGGIMIFINGLWAPCVVNSGSPRNPGACIERDRSLLVGGVVTAGAGIVGLLIGAALNPQPIELGEARKLTDDFNAKLKSSAQKPKLQFDVIATKDNLGLSVRGAF